MLSSIKLTIPLTLCFATLLAHQASAQNKSSAADTSIKITVKKQNWHNETSNSYNARGRYLSLNINIRNNGRDTFHYCYMTGDPSWTFTNNNDNVDIKIKVLVDKNFPWCATIAPEESADRILDVKLINSKLPPQKCRIGLVWSKNREEIPFWGANKQPQTLPIIWSNEITIP